MDTEQLNNRIAQWEKMAADAPDGMAFFSLGNAYKDADRYDEARGALEKAIDLDPALSRAYQLLGQVLIKLNNNEAAGLVLTKGYTVAVEHGDVMPERAMAQLLEKLGQPIPTVERKAPRPVNVGEGEILDRRTGQTGTRLKNPPLPGAIGKFIADHYSVQTWNEWIGQGTKVINELRLDFSKLQHQDTYEQHMLEWLGFTKDEAEQYAQ